MTAPIFPVSRPPMVDPGGVDETGAPVLRIGWMWMTAVVSTLVIVLGLAGFMLYKLITTYVP